MSQNNINTGNCDHDPSISTISNMTTFETLPPEIQTEIFSYCDLSSLLQLRRVSKKLKVLVDSSTQFAIALEDVCVSLKTENLESFVTTAPRLPFSNFYLDVSSNDVVPDLYINSPYIEIFQNDYCARIRKLKLSICFCCVLDSEFDFFKSLKNLRELDIVELEPFQVKTVPANETEVCRSPVLPRIPYNTGKSLKRLVVHHEFDSGDYIVRWIRSCPMLESTKIPELLGEVQRSAIGTVWTGKPKRCASSKWQSTTNDGYLLNLKRLDLQNLDVCSDEDIILFREIVFNKHVRLENVTPLFLRRIQNNVNYLPETKAQIKGSIISFKGMSDILFDGGFDSLESLIFTTQETIEWNLVLGNIELPALKKIDARIISVHERHAERMQDFIECVFLTAKPRSTVMQLEIQYVVEEEEEMVQLRFQPQHLDSSFPNLTRLILDTDIFTRRELCQLIEVISKKTALEELSITTFYGIPEQAFLANCQTATSPFLNLKSLKTLLLQSLDDAHDSETMGDEVIKIFSKMNLRRLEISGNGWENVTVHGIQCLLEGPFGRTILFAQLNALARQHFDQLERLARLAHNNRVTLRLTCSSFEQFQEADKARCVFLSWPEKFQFK